MSMTAGDETVAAGTMAKAIHDALEALIDSGASGEEARKRVAAAIAQGVVGYIQANADVVIPADGIATGYPATDKTFGVD